MKAIKISNCGKCFFYEVGIGDHGKEFCANPTMDECRELKSNEIPFPTWCPLIKEPLLIELED